MNKALAITVLMLISGLVSAQYYDKFYATDLTVWKTSKERKAHEVKLDAERAKTISVLLEEDRVDLLLADSIVKLYDAYTVLIDNARSTQLMLDALYVLDSPTQHELAKMKVLGLKLGNYNASNKEIFSLKEFRDVFNKILKDQKTLTEKIKTISSNKQKTDAHHIIRTEYDKVRNNRRVNIRPLVDKILTSLDVLWDGQ